MKRLIYSIILLALGLQMSAADKIELSKNYKELYPVDRASQFIVENKFGNIIIADWDRDEISINLDIKVTSKKQELAEKYLKLITAEIKNENNIISAITIFEKKWKTNKRVEIDIKYTIKAPAYLNYNITNKFGNIAIAKITGPTTIDLKFGNLLAKDFSFTDTQNLNHFEFSYSNINIQNCNYADIEIKYGKLIFGTGKALKLDSKYAVVKIENLETIHLEGQYGGFKLDTVSIANIEAKYMDVKIDYLSTKIESEIKYGNLKINNISPEFSKVHIEGSYGNVKLLIHPDAVYKLNSDIGYGSLTLPSKVNIDKFIRKEGTGESAEGIVGPVGKEVKSEVNIRMKYGNVKL